MKPDTKMNKILYL